MSERPASGRGWELQEESLAEYVDFCFRGRVSPMEGRDDAFLARLLTISNPFLEHPESARPLVDYLIDSTVIALSRGSLANLSFPITDLTGVDGPLVLRIHDSPVCWSSRC